MTTPGGQPHYSDLAITTALTLRAVFRRELQQAEGLIAPLLGLLGIDLPVPEPVRASAAIFPPLGRRDRSLELPAQPLVTGGPIHLPVDSSGLKLSGPGEWLVEKLNTNRRRSWLKLHMVRSPAPLAA